MSLLLAESGSTKTDWVHLVDGEIAHTFSTDGTNPYHQSPQQIAEALSTLNQEVPSPSAVSFYGAGCGPQANRLVIQEQLRSIYPQATIEVEHDLLAACRSVSAGERSVVMILGTGSNTCLFDGEQILENKTALGYVLGDEGGGAHLGKLLLQAFIHNQLSAPVHHAFQENYGNDVNAFLTRIYKEPVANRYLATFAPFISTHLQDDSVKSLVLMSFNQLFELYVSTYPNYNEVGCAVVGSIAHHFQDILRTVASAHGTVVKTVLQRPMEGLIQFHLNR